MIENNQIKTKIEITSEYGTGFVDGIEITELGYLRISVYYPEQMVWHSHLLKEGVKLIQSIVRGLETNEKYNI